MADYNKDRDLIFLYSENARIRIKDISTIIKKSPQRLKYTLRMMDKEGLIHSPHCIFDYSYFGLLLFRVYFKGGYISERDKNNIIEKLSENPYITSMYELSGEFDLAIEIASLNPSRFNKELKKISDLIPTLNNYKIILNVVTHLYPKFYLLRNSNLVSNVPQELIIGGDRRVTVFNKNEMNIIKNLLNNPKLRLTHLARQSDINIKTAISIIKNLQEKKIIKGFKHMIDINKLGIYKFRLFLKLHNLSKEREEELLNYMLKTKEITQINKTVGDWDMEIDIETLDKNKARYIILQIREEFKELIETFNIIEFYQYYKKSYLPSFLFTREIIEQI